MFVRTHPEFWNNQYRNALRYKVEDLCSSAGELDRQSDDQIMYQFLPDRLGVRIGVHSGQARKLLKQIQERFFREFHMPEPRFDGLFHWVTLHF